MKNKLVILALAGSFGFFAACTGDHHTSQGKDTVGNRFGATDSTKADTIKTTSSDNSASGGTQALDSAAKKDSSKKK